MTALELGYLIRGLLAEGKIDTGALGSYIVKLVQESEGPRAAPREVSSTMQALTLPPFCAHNINIAEDCAACAKISTGGRVFALILPIATRVVYTLKSNPPPT